MYDVPFSVTDLSFKGFQLFLAAEHWSQVKIGYGFGSIIIESTKN